jgi:hypothetical protein
VNKCSLCKYSKGGNLLAVVVGFSTVFIYDMYGSYEIIYKITENGGFFLFLNLFHFFFRKNYEFGMGG